MMDDLSMALAASGGISETEYFVIDNDLRSISIPSNMRIAGVENDDDINRIPFRMPRYVKDTDLSDFQIRINYTNALGEGDLYMVQDKVVDDNTISFSWLLDRHAFASKGEISFVVCARLVVENSLVDKEFNTTVHKLTVLQGLETDKAVPVDVQDHFLDWLQEEADIQVARIQSVGSQIQEDIEDLIESIPSDYSELQNDKAPAIIDTASGAVANFLDGADDIPIKDLSVGIEPVQDLHGYDNPWPAGGGVNIWDEQWELGSFDSSGNPSGSSTSIRCKNYIPVTPGNTYLYFNASASSQAPWLYDVNKEFIQRWGSYMSSGTTITIPEGCYYIKFALPETYGTTYKNDVAWNYPATVTTYSPYSNICPISGWMGANVTHTGKNLLPPQNITGSKSNVTVSSNGDIVTLNGTANAYGQAISNNSFVLPAGTYFLKPFVVSGDIQNTTNYELRPLNGSIIYCRTSIGRAFTLTEPTELYGRVTYSNGTVLNNLKIRAMITQGAEDPSTFEPYQGETYSITFPSEAGTVYGGTLDVTTGKLTVDRAIRVFDGTGTGWFVSSDYINRFGKNADDTLKNSGEYSKFISNYLKSTEWGTTKYTFGLRPNGTLYVALDMEATALTLEQFRAYLAENPLTICYELATPIVYDLTPTEVTMLLGTNNIWADTGDSTVEYRADTKLYIDKKIATLAAAMN